MNLEFRDFVSHDMPLLWELHNLFQPGNEPIEFWLERAGRPANTDGAAETVSLDGQVAGFLRLSSPQKPVGYRSVRLAVQPAFRNRGIGAALWARLNRHIQRLEVPTVRVPMANPDANSYRFLERNGFEILERSLRSTLPLGASVDLTLVRQLETRGYRFFALLQAGDTLENRENLYRLVRESVEDDPSFEGEFETLQEFNHRLWDVYWRDAATIFIASSGDDWVALSGAHLQSTPEQGAATSLAGVKRSHRGGGLAQAVKLLVIDDLTKRGSAGLRTANDSRNAPMLAINRKLGFQPSGEFVWFQRKLSG